MFAQRGNWRLKQIIAKIRSAKDVGKRKKLTTLNSTHTLFDQALRAPKRMYDKQHGKAKGTISGQASVRTTQHNMTAKSWSVVLKHHDIVGEKKSKDKGGKDWSAKRIGKQHQVTALNLTHNQTCFMHAQRKPKEKYEGQHGAEKGSILRRTSLKTTRAKRRPQSLKWYTEPSRRRGFKETRRQM